MPRNDQHVRDYLLGGIREGRFPPGARLPTERALCEALSVSRSTVRNALGLLEGEGRIVRIGGSGTYVAETGCGPAANGTDLVKTTSPAQVMEARLVIEPQLAHLIAANGTAADFDRFDECVAEGAAAERLEAFEHWDAALHAALADAARNPLVGEAYRLVTRARDGGQWGELKRRSLTPERRAIYQREHERIAAALRRRDAEAAEDEIRRHLVRVRANLLGR